ncbi:MAG: NAD-dependent epimerase/dehydratase family protein [Armatimonas sp.]
MRVLVLGGSGTISAALVAQLVEQGQHDVFVFNRGKRSAEIPGVTVIQGDRYDYAAFEAKLKVLGHFDVVIEMISYTPDDAESLVRACSGSCDQLIFCSTVDVYEKPAPTYPIVEGVPAYNHKSPWKYAADKCQCEEILTSASERGAFSLTIIRPVQTYNGLWVLDSLGTPSPRHLGRMMQGKPIIVHGDGHSLWGAVHSRDCATAFFGAIGNPNAYGNAYHTGPDETFAWVDYQRAAARAIGAQEPTFVPIPTEVLLSLTQRAFVTAANFAHNNAFDSSAAKRDLGYVYRTRWEDGVKEGYEALLSSGGSLDFTEDDEYERILQAWERARAALL